MPAELTYPGVYIEEVPSGVRPIIGVSTSITAFVGQCPEGTRRRAGRDPLASRTSTRIFGGLWADSR